MSRSGALLARDVDVERLDSGVRLSGQRSRDHVLTPEHNPPWIATTAAQLAGLAVSGPLGLGAYDHANHYLRIDEAPHLYFIQGTPPNSRENRWICRIDPHSLRIEPLFPLRWELTSEAHVQASSGLYVDDEIGEALIVGYQHSDGGDCRRAVRQS